MARVTYQASVENRAYDPNLIPDTTARILKQGEDYIQRLKEARDFEAAQDAQFLAEYEGKLAAGLQSERAADSEQEKQARALASFKQAALQEQANRAATIGQAGSNDKTSAWIDFAVNISKTAGDIYSDYQKGVAKIDEEVATNILQRYAVTPKSIGANYQLGTLKLLDSKNQTLASMADVQGDPELAEQIRGASPAARELVRAGLAEKYGKLSVSEMIREMNNPNSEMEVLIDGESVPINDVPQTTDNMNKVWVQWNPQYFKAQGFNDLSNPILNKGLGAAQTQFEQTMGQMRRKELEAAQANRIDQADAVFNTKVDDPAEAALAFADLYQTFFNNNGGNHSEARSEAFKRLDNPSSLSQEAFDAIGDKALPGQDLPLREQYPDEWDELSVLRSRSSENTFSISESARSREDAELAREVTNTILLDMGPDGDVDVPEDVLKQKYEHYKMLGYTETAKAYQAAFPHQSSVKNDAALEEKFEGLQDTFSLSQEQILSSDASLAVKKKWLKLVNASAEQAPRQADIDYFKSLSKRMLEERTGFEPGSDSARLTSDGMRMHRIAQDKYIKDYKTAIRGGQDQASAHAYAEGQFNAEFEKEKGLYAVNGIERDSTGTLLKPGTYINGGPKASETLDEPYVALSQAKDKYGAAVYETKGVVSRGELQRTLNYYKSTGKMVITPAVMVLSDYSGGKYSPIDVLNMQLKANGMEEVPKDPYRMAKQVEQQIPAEWLPVLNRSTSTLRDVDASMIASGQDMIYAQSTPTQERIKQIFSSRESPVESYDAINRGRGGDTPGGARGRYGKPLTQMTLGEVKRLQAQELNAVGKYQFIEGTLREAAADAGITDDMLFNEAVQDRIFFVHLDKHGAYGPWERWWIEQGGAHLALTPEEKAIIDNWRAKYNPDDPWANLKNLNPNVIRPGSTLPGAPPSPELPKNTAVKAPKTDKESQ